MWAPLACCVPHLPLGLTDTMACLQLRAFRAQLAKRAASIQRSMHDSRAAASPRLSHHDLSRLVVRGSHIEPSDVSFADAEAGTCTCRRHHARVNHSASAAGVCVCVCVCVCVVATTRRRIHAWRRRFLLARWATAAGTGSPTCFTSRGGADPSLGTHTCAARPAAHPRTSARLVSSVAPRLCGGNALSNTRPRCVLAGRPRGPARSRRIG